MSTSRNKSRVNIIQPKKITVKQKMSSEVLNIALVIIVTMVIFTTVGQKLLVPKYAKNYINNINTIFTDYAKDKDYPLEVESSYGFVEINQNEFVSQYLKKNDTSEDMAYESYLEARVEILTKVRANEDFQENNAKFNTVYFVVFGLALFLPVFLFEFVIPLFSLKSQTLAMRLSNFSILTRDNLKPSSIRLISRFFIIYLAEHIVLRLFFGNFYFIVLILIHFIFTYATRDRLVLHDLASGTKVAPFFEDNKQ